MLLLQIKAHKFISHFNITRLSVNLKPSRSNMFNKVSHTVAMVLYMENLADGKQIGKIKKPMSGELTEVFMLNGNKTVFRFQWCIIINYSITFDSGVIEEYEVE